MIMSTASEVNSGEYSDRLIVYAVLTVERVPFAQSPPDPRVSPDLAQRAGEAWSGNILQRAGRFVARHRRHAKRPKCRVPFSERCHRKGWRLRGSPEGLRDQIRWRRTSGCPELSAEWLKQCTISAQVAALELMAIYAQALNALAARLLDAQGHEALYQALCFQPANCVEGPSDQPPRSAGQCGFLTGRKKAQNSRERQGEMDAAANLQPAAQGLSRWST